MSFATDEWSGSNLTIYGSTNPVETCVKRMDGETLSAGWIKLGTEAGSANLVAVNSTLTLSSSFYVGYESSPGHPTGLSASVFLTNSTLTCGSNTDFILGYNVAGAGPISAEIGPGSMVNCRSVYRICNPSPTLTFTGGRMVLNGSGRAHLFAVEGRTWKPNTWPNEGMTVSGDGAPIDVEVSSERKLAGGWAIRKVYLRGNGGFVKRGAGKLLWGWYTYGSNNGYLGCIVDYTGDTVIKAGGIELATPSAVEKAQITYKTAAGSALKIEEGAYFDFAGNPATFLGVSGAGTLTNSSAAATTLTLGSTNGDGEFSPAIVGGAFDVVKTGTGTLAVATAHIDGMLWVSNGTVRIASGTSFSAREIRVEAHKTLDVRGAHVTCEVLSAPRSASILWDADTVLDGAFVFDGDDICAAGRFGMAGALRKTGGGTITLLGQSAKGSGTVSIDGGSVVCKPAATWPGKYFIINFYGDVHKDTHDGVAISEFSLYGADGNRVNQGTYSYTPLPAAETQQYGNYGGIDDATQLAECEVAVWMPNHNGFIGANGSPVNLFDGSPSTSFRFSWYWSDSNKFVFRIPDDAPEAVGFSFTTTDTPNRRPTQWKLWGSVDGETWTELANNSTNTSDAVVWAYLTNSTPDTVQTEYSLMPLDKLPAASASYAPFGDAEVSVADGATLDFASAEMTLSRLNVDLDANGGTITRCTPATNGVINLSATSPVASGRAIPLTVTEMASPNNLKSWTVRVNGVERADLGVRWSNGVLRVSGGGLQIIFR